jgi:hypothetical protein
LGCGATNAFLPPATPDCPWEVGGAQFPDLRDRTGPIFSGRSWNKADNGHRKIRSLFVHRHSLNTIIDQDSHFAPLPNLRDGRTHLSNPSLDTARERSVAAKTLAVRTVGLRFFGGLW